MNTPHEDLLIGWVEEPYPKVNKLLDVIREDEYDERLKVPTYVYVTVGIRGKEVRLGFDTGSVRSLLSEEVYSMINADNMYNLQPHGTQFEAVNGSKIECLGFIKLPVLFYGFQNNYAATVKFYIIRGLELQGLLGIDEISRHSLTVNPNDGTCFQPKAGRMHVNVVFREDRGVRKVVIAEDVILPPQTSCDIRVKILGLKEGEQGEGIVQPRKDIWKWGISASRILTGAQQDIITRVQNHCQSQIMLDKGDSFGQFNYTTGSPMLINTIVEEEGYGECLLEGEELDDPMVYEDFESKNLKEVDFGLDKANVTEEQKIDIRNELEKYKEVFQWDECPVSFTHKIRHKIVLKPGTVPVKQKNRKFSEEQNRFIDAEVQKLINQDIIQPSLSNWSTRIVLSWEPRKNRWRLCLDYRTVNSLSVAPMAHPLPNIEELLDQFRGQVYFHTLDLYQGYHQCQLEEESREITAFATRKGLFEFKRMPFGLNSCPTTYQALMEAILGELCWKSAVAYIDDVIIFGSSYKEAFERLKAVLEKLREAGLKLRASKCRLFQSSVEFLGFIISEGGIHTCKHIVDAVVNFPKPNNVKEVQRFLGICNYYRTFIKSHSKILAPIINLTRKGNPFSWTMECQNAMDILKHKLTNAPVRNYYNPELPIVLTTDASGRGIGATLSQVNKEGKMLLLAFGSRVLKPPEVSWSTTEKECFAIAHWVKKYRHYLANPFIVFSDHASLRYVSTMRDSSQKIARWLNFLMQFSFEVHHKAGDSKEMVVADILSRIMSEMKENSEETLAIKMEKPVLRLHRGTTSPVLMSWFCIEKPTRDDFDSENRLIMDMGGELKVEEEPRERGSQLRIVLKRMQKEVESEEREGTEDLKPGKGVVLFIRERMRANEMDTFRIVSDSEVEYL